MELKPYQQQVISDISLFLEHLQATKNTALAFNDFWVNHPRMSVTPFPSNPIEPYKHNIPSVPHVCIKVPTAGGKTFIACNAIRTIFDAFDPDKTKAVVWLVPSITILEQTIKNLKDPSHPYRQKINALFGGRVEIFDKATLLQGSGFNAASVKEQLNIMVFSFDSLRAKNKEDRKVFQENGNLQTFENLIPNQKDITLGEVIKYLNPLVVVDESHNAESDLSIEMLKEVNPCFILDLTATPRKNSNIISFIDALELKRENMVKLPVIVYNYHDKTDVISSALDLQRKLELQAKEEEKKGLKYIRPIVLFQAQPKNGKDFSNTEEEKSNVQKLKYILIEKNIPADHIKIKTANINEIKGIDLMSKDCEVRYIITINALKEGWDCPFAYILASLADKNSAVDVEQILGRILRQPYVMKHNNAMLNMSYVLTASSKFLDTLDNIVKGLNKAGFSSQDYKLKESAIEDAQTSTTPISPQQDLFGTPVTTQPPQTVIEPLITQSEDITEGIDVSKITIPSDTPTNSTVNTSLAEIESIALTQNKEFEAQVSKIESSNTPSIPNEMQKQVKLYTIKEIFLEQAQKMNLPQFHIKVPSTEIFGNESEVEILLEKDSLLKGFVLSKADTNIDFESITSDLYRVDIDETAKEHTPTFLKIDGKDKDFIMAYLLDPARKENRVKNFSKRIMSLIGNMYPISDKDIEKYINRVLEDFTDEQFNDLASKENTYTDKIKFKIKSLSEAYAEKKFKDQLDIDRVYLKPSYTLPNSISPGEVSKAITKSLYEKEGKINGFEEKVINEIANMSNIAFWTRNIDRRGFKINGFINHYPDFIIQSKSGKTILLETKGDHLDAEQKITLGNLWASAAGSNFKYFMVYERRTVDGAYKLDDFINIIKAI